MISIEQHSIAPDIIVLQVEGRITAGAGSLDFAANIEALLTTGARKIVLDLAAVSYLDSTALGIIVMFAGKLKKSAGELRISGPVGSVANTLALCKVSDIVLMFATTDLAVSSFRMAAGAA